jgi:hypothetical protein
MALVTALPPYSEPPSLSSTASNAPVEAPLGTPRPAYGPVVQRYLDLEGRVTAGIEDLPGMDRFNGGHRQLLAL